MRRKIIWLTFLITLTFWLAGLGGCASTGGDQNHMIEGDTAAEGYPATAPNGEATPVAPATEESKPGVLGQLASGVGNLFKPKSPLDENAALTREPATASPDSPAKAVDAPVPAAEPAPAATVAQAEPAPAPQPAAEAPAQPAPVADAPVAPEPPVVAPPLIPPAVSDTQPSLTNGLDRSHWAKVPSGPMVGVTGHYPTYFKDYPLPPRESMAVNQDTVPERIDAAFDGSRAKGLCNKRNAAGVVVQPVKFGLDMLFAPFKMVFDKHPLTPVYEPKVDATYEPEASDPVVVSEAEPAVAPADAKPAPPTPEAAPAEPAPQAPDAAK